MTVTYLADRRRPSDYKLIQAFMYYYAQVSNDYETARFNCTHWQKLAAKHNMPLDVVFPLDDDDKTGPSGLKWMRFCEMDPNDAVQQYLREFAEN